MLGQHFTEFGECRVGMFGDKLPDFLFVGFEFWFRAVSLFLGGDGACLASFFAKVIDPRGTDRVFFGDILTTHSGIAILQNSFSQIQRIGCTSKQGGK